MGMREKRNEGTEEVKTRQRMSEGCSLASKHCSKLSAQYGPEGTTPLLTQTYHTHTHRRREVGISHLSPLFQQETACMCVYTDLFAADW